MYYEVDGSAPPILYTGTPIVLDSHPDGHSLWLQAEDEAGNTNGGGVSVDYSFMSMEKAVETASQEPWVDINDSDGLFFIQITGFGFDATTPATIQFTDVDGDVIMSSIFSTYTETAFLLSVDMNAPVSGGNEVVDPGMGTITLTNNDPNLAVDAIGFEIKDP